MIPLYIILSLCLFFIIFGTYISFKSKEAMKGSILTAITAYSLHLFMTILFIPIIQYILSILKCKENNKGEQVHYIFNEVCFGSMHLIHIGIAIVTLFLFLLITSMGCLFFHRITLNQANCFTMY